MTPRARQTSTREALRSAPGVLLVLRDPLPAMAPTPGQPAFVASDPREGPEPLIAVWDDATVTAFHGHVDLGTGLRTALTQIVAEELAIDPAAVHLVMGSTALAPNQGATIASASLQIHAQPLRIAAAQARAWLLAQADPSKPAANLAATLAARHVELMLDLNTPVKSFEDYRLVGQSLPRVDIPAKVMGDAVFVHDMRLPGMLHGRVIRPPYAGVDSGEFIGRTLESVDRSSVAQIPGIRAVVIQGDFVGVVAEREEHAELAMKTLRVTWKPWTGPGPLDDLGQAIRTHPSTPRELVNEGALEEALAGADRTLERTYIWPYQMHASIGPSCALAVWDATGLDSNGLGSETEAAPGSLLRVWAGTQNPHALRADLALLMSIQPPQVDLIRMEAAGCYGRNGADDVAADAALLARAVGAPVRVQLSREQENAWDPKGAAQWMQVRGGLHQDGTPAGYDFQTSYPSNGAPTLALLLTRTIEPTARAFEMGDRTARPPYDYPALRVTVNDMAPILRASWLRGVSALPNSFAHESFIDELASAAGVDPVQYRLRLLEDPRARELIEATATRAGWQPHDQPQQQGRQGDWLQGQGFAYARYIHSRWPGFGAAWAAWVADVEVHSKTGEVHVKRVVVGHDAGQLINPAGVTHQIHGNVIQTTSRALLERVATDPLQGTVIAPDWGSYPILSFREVPVIEVLQMPRPGEAPLGAGESSSVPGTAAIANAIFDATGIRFRQPPFTPEVVRAALNPLEQASSETPPTHRAEAVPGAGGRDESRPAGGVVRAASMARPSARLPVNPSGWRRRVGQFMGLSLGLLTAGLALLGWRANLAPIDPVDLSAYNASMLARGQRIAAIGHCSGCHTADEGQANAGGRPLETPFGVIYSTNLTPDPETGIGRWSYRAFERAMRDGLSRDGHHLYPAFPYTAFAGMRDEDMMALYGWLMSQPAIHAPTPATQLGFPFSVRPLMALWNGLFHQAAPLATDPARSALWNRGAYLVNHVANCGGCHTPRNAMGAERNTTAYLRGARNDGWDAPALDALNRAPIAWTEAAFYSYLRQGHTQNHGAAAGPMAGIVRELSPVPDEDLQAIAHYLASLGGQQRTREGELAAQSQALVARAVRQAPPPGVVQRQFEGSCGGCHHEGTLTHVFGQNLPLALNTNLYSEQPDNLIRIILDGIQAPPSVETGFMPGFRDSLTEAQLTELVQWMRLRFAPGQAPWANLADTVRRIREEPMRPFDQGVSSTGELARKPPL